MGFGHQLFDDDQHQLHGDDQCVRYLHAVVMEMQKEAAAG